MDADFFQYRPPLTLARYQKSRTPLLNISHSYGCRQTRREVIDNNCQTWRKLIECEFNSPLASCDIAAKMGIFFAKKKQQSRVTEQDKAILVSSQLNLFVLISNCLIIPLSLIAADVAGKLLTIIWFAIHDKQEIMFKI